jgi:hypothetical protein
MDDQQVSDGERERGEVVPVVLLALGDHAGCDEQGTMTMSFLVSGTCRHLPRHRLRTALATRPANLDDG